MKCDIHIGGVGRTRMLKHKASFRPDVRVQGRETYEVGEKSSIRWLLLIVPCSK